MELYFSNQVAISEKEFKELYPEKYHWVYSLLTSTPLNIKDLVNNYLPVKLWRLNNLYKIVDKQGNLIPFRLNRSQFIVNSAKLKHNRLIILKSRQQGISTYWLIDFLDDVIFIPNLSAGLMAQGLDEASKLLDRTKIAWDNFPLKQFLGIERERNNTKEFSFTNGSTLFIRTSFRSATLQRLHVSEVAKIALESPKKIKELFSGTLQAIHKNLRVVFESTGENDEIFQSIWTKAWGKRDKSKLAPKDFYPIFLSMIGDPDCEEETEYHISPDVEEYFAKAEAELGVKISKKQKNYWMMQREELGDDIYKEYPLTPEDPFTSKDDGTYYKKHFNFFVIRNKRLVENLYDKNLGVYVAFDLGLDDFTVWGAAQVWEKQLRFVDECYNNDEEISWYVDRLLERGYYIERIILPHDAKSRNLVTKESVYTKIRRMCDAPITVMEKTPSLVSDIYLVKSMIKYMWFDVNKCKYLIRCMQKYRKKWSEKMQAFKGVPDHDKPESHGADMIRYMCKYLAKYFIEGEKYYEEDEWIDDVF